MKMINIGIQRAGRLPGIQGIFKSPEPARAVFGDGSDINAIHCFVRCVACDEKNLVAVPGQAAAFFMKYPSVKNLVDGGNMANT